MDTIFCASVTIAVQSYFEDSNGFLPEFCFPFVIAYRKFSATIFRITRNVQNFILLHELCMYSMIYSNLMCFYHRKFSIFLQKACGVESVPKSDS